MMSGVVGGLGEACQYTRGIPWATTVRYPVCSCARCFIARRSRDYVTGAFVVVSAPLIRRTAWLPRKVSL